jgi:hypothetical protein
MKQEVPEEILRNLKSWNRIAQALRFAFVFLGLSATLAGLIATTYGGDVLDKFWTKFWTLTAAASIGILTAFDIGGKANSVRRAWRKLNAAVLLYRADPDYSIQALITEFQRAEALIGDVNYIPQKTEEQPRSRRGDKPLTPPGQAPKGKETPLEPGTVPVTGNGQSIQQAS